MKKRIATAIFLLMHLAAMCQQNFDDADRKALQLPDSLSYTTRSIAAYIQNNCIEDIQKVRAAYTWVIHNIEYSKDSMYQFNRWGIDPSINLNAVLRRRKGVCENYAALFSSIVQQCGVLSVVVTGYTNLPGNQYWNGHGWVAVKIGTDWLLCDPTWDAGYNTYTYFLVAPAAFIHSHMPFDPLWQLLEQPISHHNFRKGNFAPQKDHPVFYYRDSVTAYLLSDTLTQMQQASRRMQQSGFESDDLKTWYQYNEMKVHIVLQEENMQLFNDATAQLNKAKQLYNEFIQYRNNGFLPAQPGEDVNKLFASSIMHLKMAEEKLRLVGVKSENYQYDTEGLEENILVLKGKINNQQAFWKQYSEATGQVQKKSPKK